MTIIETLKAANTAPTLEAPAPQPSREDVAELATEYMYLAQEKHHSLHPGTLADCPALNCMNNVALLAIFGVKP